MEIKGLVERSVNRRQDYIDSHDILRTDPDRVKNAESSMRKSVERLSTFATPTQDHIRGKKTADFPFATPWVCETAILGSDLDLAVSIRLAHDYRPEHQRGIWHGLLQLVIAQPGVQGAYLGEAETIAEFTVYGKDNDAVFIMNIQSDSDSGNVGSASWDQINDILNEANLELSQRSLDSSSHMVNS